MLVSMGAKSLLFEYLSMVNSLSDRCVTQFFGNISEVHMIIGLR